MVAAPAVAMGPPGLVPVGTPDGVLAGGDAALVGQGTWTVS